MKKMVKSGYSNNSDYFGDWFGKGQIDFDAIINPEDDGDLWMVKLWSGSGYALDVYLCKANDMYEAMNIVFEWSYENEGHNEMVFDFNYVYDEAYDTYDEYVKHPDWFSYGDNLSKEDFADRYIEDNYINDDGELYARSENFFVDKVPDEVLAENRGSVQNSRKSKKGELVKSNRKLIKSSVDSSTIADILKARKEVKEVEDRGDEVIAYLHKDYRDVDADRLADEVLGTIETKYDDFTWDYSHAWMDYSGDEYDDTYVVIFEKNEIESSKNNKRILSGLDRNKDSLNGVFNSSRKPIKSSDANHTYEEYEGNLFDLEEHGKWFDDNKVNREIAGYFGKENVKKFYDLTAGADVSTDGYRIKLIYPNGEEFDVKSDNGMYELWYNSGNGVMHNLASISYYTPEHFLKVLERALPYTQERRDAEDPLKSSRKSIRSAKKKAVTREKIKKELDRVLEKNKISLNDDVYKETVDYILSFWDDDFDDPKDVEEAVHEWYLDTKRNFPDVFTRGHKQRVASSRHFNWVKSAYLEYIHSSRKPIKSDLDFVNKGDKTIVKKNGRIVAFIGERPYGGFYYAFGKPSANHYMSFDVDDYETAVSRIKEFAEDEEGVFSSFRKPIKSLLKRN